MARTADLIAADSARAFLTAHAAELLAGERFAVREPEAAGR